MHTAYSQSVISKAKLRQQPKRLTDFYDFIRPVYIFCRIFGLLPFRINCDSNHNIKSTSVGAYDIAWFLISISINLTFIYLILPSIKPSNEFRSSVLYVGGRLILLVGYILATLSIILDLFNRNRITGILMDFYSFDKKVKSICVL